MYKSVIEKRLQALNIPADIDIEEYANLLVFYDEIIGRYSSRPAFTSLGRTITYSELDDYANAFAYYLQTQTDLKVGDRIAIQLPNIIQSPVAFLGSLRAGLIIVNVNPLYTATELEHQFNDAGVKALVVLANIADTVATVIDKTSIETVIVTELADLHKSPKRQALNFAIKHIKKMVPEFSIPKAVKFTQVMKQGANKIPQLVYPKLDDTAVLQYTGGTTGVAKGAMLSHGNILANMHQATPIFNTYGLSNDGECIIQPLPLYHIYAFTVGLIILAKGAHTVLIPNPRDIPALVKECRNWKIDAFCGLNTLFVALCNNDDFKQLDFKHLKMTLSGGMALTSFAADLWREVTGKEIYEGYGLTETSPIVSVNSGNGMRPGTIGVPLPLTQIDIRDEDHRSLNIGERGELCIKGPQVMKGYWQHEQATNETIIDGWLYTGDIATLSKDGYLTIVDRKKDMILTSGFNVYPNEVEEVACNHTSILEACAVACDDQHSGEVVHLYVVKTSAENTITEADMIDFCRLSLAGYKVPKKVFFKDELPKTNVGKILRRKVRENAQMASG